MTVWTWIKLVAALLLLAGAFGAGWRANGWRYEAQRTADLEAAARARQVEENRVMAVAVAYTKMTAELRRIQAARTREVIRETQRVEYRCVLPDAGRVLLDAATDAANAAAGGTGAAVPPGRKAADR